MARLPASKGGWFKLWGKQWLLDEKLKELGDSGELAYLRILCLSNTLLNSGIFKDMLENPLSSENIQNMARISQSQFELLVGSGLVIKQDGYYFVKNWDKHQGNRYKPDEVAKSHEKPHKNDNRAIQL